MIVPSEYMGISLLDLEKDLAASRGGIVDQPFKWDSKYLPVVLGFAGVVTVFLVAGIIRKKKKGKK